MNRAKFTLKPTSSAPVEIAARMFSIAVMTFGSFRVTQMFTIAPFSSFLTGVAVAKIQAFSFPSRSPVFGCGHFVSLSSFGYTFCRYGLYNQLMLVILKFTIPSQFCHTFDILLVNNEVV